MCTSLTPASNRQVGLNATVQQHPEALRNLWITEQADSQLLYRKWSLTQPALNHVIPQLREEIRQHEEAIDGIFPVCSQ